jgi:hypothetical protein
MRLRPAEDKRGLAPWIVALLAVAARAGCTPEPEARECSAD